MTSPLHTASSIELQTRRQQQRVQLHKPISVINMNTHKVMGASQHYDGRIYADE